MMWPLYRCQCQISRVCDRFDNCTTKFVWAHHPAEVNATMCTGSAIAVAIILTLPDAKVSSAGYEFAVQGMSLVWEFGVQVQVHVLYETEDDLI